MGKTRRRLNRIKYTAKKMSKRFVRKIMKTSTYVAYHKATNDLSNLIKNTAEKQKNARIALRGIITRKIDKRLFFKALRYEIEIEMNLSKAILHKLETEKDFTKLFLKYVAGDKVATDKYLEDLNVIIKKITNISEKLSGQEKMTYYVEKQQERLDTGKIPDEELAKKIDEFAKARKL